MDKLLLSDFENSAILTLFKDFDNTKNIKSDAYDC